ncbi:MAG: phosphoribosylglycinamide synthetase C domain-containing protein, partial [Corynebacterium sp.]
GAYRTAGGRVLSVLGKGSTLAEARADAYATVDGIEFAGGFVRRDIGKRAEDGEISL